ncbi:M16 family metallopeptidase [Zunongwangia sp. HGR-M22]|uniref:M16 family metallopeptidase n=1 Tax=Zunongwangia sp. HGR-M22 TaxID=3015168 RepID=UPI0022DD7CEC|nr:insulinase family protein [Zunongwangia sp. HGR-M22]WBL24267.1 insulinase family protein [Zunongwangia sp. HGR-M22]
MHLNVYKYFYFLSLLMALGTNAQTTNEVSFQNDSLNTNFMYEKLQNGFSFYVKPLEKHSKKIHLKLFIKGGGSQEKPKERQLTHAVEHLVTKGSTHFPKGMKDYEKLEGKGIKISHISPGANHTEYNLIVPANNREAIYTALLFYRDILFEAYFRKKDIASEKEVLKQEHIIRSNDYNKEDSLNFELRSRITPCISNNGNLMSIYQNLNRRKLKAFYRKWYRPDLAVIIASGDVRSDSEFIKKTIKELYSKLKNPGKKPKILNCDSIYLNQPEKFIVLDNSVTQNRNNESWVQIKLYYRIKNTLENSNTFQNTKEKMLWNSITQVLNRRFKEASNSYTAKKYNLFSRHTMRGKPAFELNLNAQSGQEFVALTEVIHQLKQLKEYGILENEWQLAKKNLLEEMNREDRSKSFYWQNQVVAHETQGDVLEETQLLRKEEWLYHCKLKEANSHIKKMIPVLPDDIGILAMKTSKAFTLTRENLIQEIANIWDKPVAPYKQPEIPSHLINPDTIANFNTGNYTLLKTEKTGEKIYKLSNGAHIILKNYTPSNGYDKERIIIHGFRNKGASSYSPKDYFSAVNAPKIVKHSGVGVFDKFTLDSFLKNTSFWQGVHPYIDFNESGIKGSVKLSELETFLQLLYLTLNDIRKDYSAFTNWKKIQKKFYQNPPTSRFYSDLNDGIIDFFGHQIDHYSGYRALEGIDSTSFHKSYEIYKNLFRDPSAFTFIVTGSFNEKQIIGLLNNYIGKIPKNESEFSEKQHMEFNFPKGPVYKELNTPLPYANAKYAAWFINPIKSSKAVWKEEILLQILGQLTNQKISQLRYKEKFAVYSSGANGKYEPQSGMLKVNVYIDCKPSELEIIRKKCQVYYQQLKEGDFSEQYLRDAKKKVLSLHSKNHNHENKNMNELLYLKYRYDQVYPEFERVSAFIEDLSKKDLINTAGIYFQDNNTYEFVLRENNDL